MAGALRRVSAAKQFAEKLTLPSAYYLSGLKPRPFKTESQIEFFSRL